MKRLLLDTNIYGLMFVGEEFHSLHPILEEKRDIQIYGFDVIRKELKQAPKKTIKGVNIQASLLRAYSSFIVKEYDLNKKFEELAEKYFEEYQSNGGGFTKEKLWNDFLIVACASIKDITIVVSEDNGTMLNEIALNSYKKMNTESGIKLPEFIGYDKFKKLLRASSSNPIIDGSYKFGILLSFFNILPFIFHSMARGKLIYKHFVQEWQ